MKLSFTAILFFAAPVFAQHVPTLTVDPSSSGADSYNVYRGSASGGPYSKIGFTQGLVFTDTTVFPGSIYWYVATAVNEDGESTWSPEAKAVIPPTVPPPPPPPPPPPTVQYPLNLTCDTLVAAKGGKGVPNLSVTKVVLTNCVPSK